LREDLDTTQRVKVADIRIADQCTGTNSFLLLGDAASLFEVEGGNAATPGFYKNATLYLKQGAWLTATPTTNRCTIVVSPPASVAVMRTTRPLSSRLS